MPGRREQVFHHLGQRLEPHPMHYLIHPLHQSVIFQVIPQDPGVEKQADHAGQPLCGLPAMQLTAASTRSASTVFMMR